MDALNDVLGRKRILLGRANSAAHTMTSALLAPTRACIAPAHLARRPRRIARCTVKATAPASASPPLAPARQHNATPRHLRGSSSPNGRAQHPRAVTCRGAGPLFDVAASTFRVSSLANNSAALACVVAGTILVLQALDDSASGKTNRLLLLSACIFAPGAVTTWWLTSAGRAVAFGALALRTFLLGGSLGVFGRFAKAVDAVTTFGLLVIAATPAAMSWRGTKAAAALNAALCAYMVFSHMRGGGDFATASQGQYLSAGSGLRLAATLGYCALLALAIPAVGARW